MPRSGRPANRRACCCASWLPRSSATAAHPGLEGAFALIESSNALPLRNTSNGKDDPSQLDSIVFVGTRRSDLLLHEERDVDAYRRAVDHIYRVSQSPDASAKFIADLRNRMEKRRDRPTHLAEVEPQREQRQLR